MLEKFHSSGRLLLVDLRGKAGEVDALDKGFDCVESGWVCCVLGLSCIDGWQGLLGKGAKQ